MSSLDRVPEYMRASAQAYIDTGRPVGDFMMAVLTNNLKAAIAHADEENAAAMRHWVHWLYWDVPSNAHGDRETVMAWINKGGLNERAA